MDLRRPLSFLSGYFAPDSGYNIQPLVKKVKKRGAAARADYAPESN
jgi:hypothetical protein